MEGKIVKKIALLAIGLVACCSIALAGDKEELLLKKENLELKATNIQLTAQLMTKDMADIQAALKDVTAKLQALDQKESKKK